ncbi:hypothetical protein [Novipirellula aureliae]|uniref:hypothetical protein n=1 Tax=Novipirellula aureliae TaxID=2527966 RepID=UPI0011B6D0EB|nr:hypothetical protein [Novipirellula aureliae]
MLITTDDLRPDGWNRKERIWKRRQCRNVVCVFIDGEQTSIVRDCLRFGVEVLNFVSLQHNQDCPEASRKLARFLSGFLEDASPIVERKAPSIWDDAARFKPLRKRKLLPGPVANFSRTNDRRFLPGVAQLARDEIFQLVVGLPIDQSLKRQIIDDATCKIEAEIDKLATVGRQRNWFENTWQKCAVEAARAHVKSLPKGSRADLSVLGGQLLWKTPKPDKHDAIKFRQMCEIAADTRLRQDRFLRTLVLLYLGGLGRSKVASGIVDGLLVEREGKTILKRKSKSSNLKYSPKEVNERFQTVGKSDALIEAGEANRYDRLQDPFLKIAETSREGLEAELFYMADEFRRRQELWNPKWLAAFCHWLCFLCGDDETLWRSWVGPPISPK